MLLSKAASRRLLGSDAEFNRIGTDSRNKTNYFLSLMGISMLRKL